MLCLGLVQEISRVPAMKAAEQRAKKPSTAAYPPRCCSSSPTRIGTAMPPRLPAMFITPPTRPTRAGAASKTGKLQYRLPHIRKKAVSASRSHGGIGIFQARQQQEGDQRREARDRQQALGRQAAAHALADQQVAEEAADQEPTAPQRKMTKVAAPIPPDIEAARLRWVARTPGQQAEEHHGPTGAAEDDTDQGRPAMPRSSAGLAVRFGERGGAVGVDPVQLGGVDPGMLGRVVAQVVPGQPGHGQGGDAGDEEGAAPEPSTAIR